MNKFIKSTKLKSPPKKENYWPIKTQRDFLKEDNSFERKVFPIVKQT